MAKEIDYSILPEHMREGARKYIEEGVQPGRFLTAVICNKLVESFANADAINLYRMFDIASFFYNEAPSSCWGSPEDMTHWIKKGGKNGSHITKGLEETD